MFLDRWMLSRRVDQAELLDDAACSTAEAQRSLRDLRRLNEAMRGSSLVETVLLPLLAAAPKPVTLLDLGTGSGQAAQRVAQWAAAERQAVRVVGLDWMTRHLHYAREWNEHSGTPHVHLLAGDARRLPLAEGSVDYVTSSLFLHHFDEPTVRQLLRECRRVARRGVVMSDLWRQPLAFAAYKLVVEPLLVRSPVTRQDSSASFRRAYRPSEIARIARSVLPEVTVTSHFLRGRWRLVAQWEGTA